MKSHFTWPPINKKTERDVMRQLHTSISIYDRSGIFEEFENAFAKYYERKHALLCNSGTTAIHSMFVAAGFGEGDEVICPAYTFFATVSPLLFTGAKPVLCDIDENGNISPADIERKITKKTKGVVITHMWGIPCEMDAIQRICKKRGLLLLEDCSHAHGAAYKGKPVGSFGDLAAWSIQGPKNVSGGEGGILATDNDEFYYRALLLGHYNKRCKQEIPKESRWRKFAVTGMGLKYRAHPLAVAVAFNVFKNLDRYVATKDSFARKIVRELGKTGVLKPPRVESFVQPSWYALTFQYDPGKLGGLPLEKLIEAMRAKGLSEVDNPGSTMPLNLLPLFQSPGELFPAYRGRNKFSYREGDFPKAEKFYRNTLKLPVWALKKDSRMVERYVKGMKEVIENFKNAR